MMFGVLYGYFTCLVQVFCKFHQRLQLFHLGLLSSIEDICVLCVSNLCCFHLNTQFLACSKLQQSNSWGKYMSHNFQNYFQQKEIISQRSYSYTPQQIRVAKHKNQHLLDVVRTLLIESSIPSKFWVEALSITVYLINHLPMQTLQYDSPYLCLFGNHPKYQSLHTFGCVCFMGYSNAQKGFVCYDATTNKLHVSRKVIFFENQYFFQSHFLS